MMTFEGWGSGEDLFAGGEGLEWYVSGANGARRSRSSSTSGRGGGIMT